MKFKKVYIEITNSCNLNCSFCNNNQRDKKFMTIEQFQHIINEIKYYTNYVYLHVKGEPLLHPDLEEILKICSDNDIKVNITTNLLDEELLNPFDKTLTEETEVTFIIYYYSRR